MRVLAISGSPRRGGNTDLLLAQAVRGAEEAGAQVETVNLRDLRIGPCRECGGCAAEGLCVVPDDMQGLYLKLRTWERVIVASPVFFAGVTAQTKAMIDRCQACWVEKYRLKRAVAVRPSGCKGLFISVCGYNRASMFEGALATMRAWFYTLDLEPVEPVLVPGMDAAGAVAGHPEALARAHAAGRALVSDPPAADREGTP